jgi:hypothetical protein
MPARRLRGEPSCDLHFIHIGHTITVRLTKKLAAWLAHAAAKTGMSLSTRKGFSRS